MSKYLVVSIQRVTIYTNMRKSLFLKSISLRLALLCSIGVTIFLSIQGCDKKAQLEVTCANVDLSSCPVDIAVMDTSAGERKVLIIGIDGLRSDAVQPEISPTLYDFFQRPAAYSTNRNTIEDLTFSGPNWASLLTGVHWCKHNVTDNDYSNNHLTETPHFFSLIEQADSNMNTVSFANWTPINEYSAKPHADVAPIEPANDADIFSMANQALLNGSPITPDVLFLHFDELDGAGHGYGFSADVAEYVSTLTTIDGYVEQLLSTIESKRLAGEEWMVFIVTDHGGDGTGHSGGQENEHISRTIFFIDCPEVVFSSRESAQVDLVPTALKYLGVSSSRFDCYKDGVSLFD